VHKNPVPTGLKAMYLDQTLQQSLNNSPLSTLANTDTVAFDQS
jgi:hypothetical protein